MTVDAILLPLIFFYYLLECLIVALPEMGIYCKIKEITANQITELSRAFKKASCAEGGLHLGVELEMKLILEAEAEQDFHVMGGMIAQRKRY